MTSRTGSFYCFRALHLDHHMRSVAFAMLSRCRTTIVLPAMLLVYVAVAVLIGRFPFIDIVPFKAAGLHWALTGHFAAPEMRGFHGLTPPLQEIYFAHLPGYVFLFGLFVKLLGFGPWQCLLYDALIHACLAWLTFRTARTLAPALPGAIAAAAGVSILPLGTSDRPEELAACLGLMAIGPLLAPRLTWQDVCRVGLGFGLCAATSAGGAILLGLVALLLRWPPRAGQRPQLWVGAPVIAIVTLAACLAPIFWFHPTAYRQFTTHAAMQLALNRAEDYVFSLRYGWHHVALMLAVALIGILAALRSVVERRLAGFARLWGGSLVGMLILLVFFPTKHLYTWLLGPWLIALCAVTCWACFTDGDARWRRTLRWVLVPTGMLYLVATAPAMKETLVSLSLTPTQRLPYNAARLRELVPRGSRVMTSEYWWVLGSDREVIDPTFSSVEIANLDYLVFTGNGSGHPGVANSALLDDPEVTRRFVQVWNNLNHEPLTLWGLRVTRSAYGFGPVVWRRREAP